MMRWWRSYLRVIDKRTLWPECKRTAPSITEARLSFFIHTRMDYAWSDIGDDEAQVMISRWT